MEFILRGCKMFNEREWIYNVQNEIDKTVKFF